MTFAIWLGAKFGVLVPPNPCSGNGGRVMLVVVGYSGNAFKLFAGGRSFVAMAFGIDCVGGCNVGSIPGNDMSEFRDDDP